MFGSFGCAYVCSVTSSSFSTLWTVAHQTPLSWDFSGKNTGAGCQISSSRWFPWSRDRTCVSQVSLHCRRILSLLSHGGSWFVKLGVLNAFFILMFQFYILPCSCLENGIQSPETHSVKRAWLTQVRGHHQRRQWHPTPVLLPGKSYGQRSLVGCSSWGLEESDMTERLHFHFPLSCIGEGNGNPLQCSCLENPRDRGACWASVCGVAQSWTWLTWLSSIRGHHSPYSLNVDVGDPSLSPHHPWNVNSYILKAVSPLLKILCI